MKLLKEARSKHTPAAAAVTSNQEESASSSSFFNPAGAALSPDKLPTNLDLVKYKNLLHKQKVLNPIGNEIPSLIYPELVARWTALCPGVPLCPEETMVTRLRTLFTSYYVQQRREQSQLYAAAAPESHQKSLMEAAHLVFNCTTCICGLPETRICDRYTVKKPDNEYLPMNT